MKPVHDDDAKPAAEQDRTEDVCGPTIEHNVRWVSRVVEDVHLIAYWIFRFGVKTMPEGENSGAKLLPSRLVFNNRRPDPRTPFIVDNSFHFHAYDGATRMDPEAVDVEAPQERWKRQNHYYAKTNEVTHGIIDKNVDLEALALEYRFLDRGRFLFFDWPGRREAAKGQISGAVPIDGTLNTSVMFGGS